jgi:hypothetical protein
LHSERWYLHQASNLSPQRPGAESTDEMSYDPAHPVATLGARHGPECIVNQGASRQGVISYVSQPLMKETDLTGTSRAVVWVSSDAAIADFTAKLIDVYPDGYAAPLLDGATRVHATKAPQEVIIELGTTSNLFRAGHRIRIDIASSSFPKLEPSPDTAHDVIFHDVRHSSYLDISVNSRP